MEEGSLFQRMKQIFQIKEDVEDEGVWKEAAELIRNIFRYMDKDAKDIMTHRKNIVAIDGNEKLADALRFMLDESYSRFPIYEEGIDEIIGTIHLREAMTCYFNEDLRQMPVKQLDDYIRPVAFIPETKSIDTLFKEMQAEKNHIAIVLDEYGQTSGLVAMEDILEEIVGNILDEYDEEEELIEILPDGRCIASGMTDLEDLEDMLPMTFEKEEYETLNGFLVDQLDRIPSEEETCIVEYDGYRFTVLSVDNNTIERVKIEKLNEEC
ncbi:hemolysin family protein [[Clostridium] hylemonae]|uniref:CBS domain protein n=1 Tax=[Clostridium] hylemonae DSM 15053 TaxID=553973 RepID=C0BVZ0_9FIRM|nr:hemolysin family protein [[Clostridium] hylemonae]EEG75922.1 CBS domain protein [[Clostridium] hylemonae DSM 15053]QEK17621.1 Magnesium and cobalt efflux protein CorC [[Clostridium] hylemonae DSM 15053]